MRLRSAVVRCQFPIFDSRTGNKNDFRSLETKGNGKGTQMAVENYGFCETIEGFGFYEVKEKIVQALADEGFGILTEIDVQASLKKKLDISLHLVTKYHDKSPPILSRGKAAI